MGDRCRGRAQVVRIKEAHVRSGEGLQRPPRAGQACVTQVGQVDADGGVRPTDRGPRRHVQRCPVDHPVDRTVLDRADELSVPDVGVANGRVLGGGQGHRAVPPAVGGPGRHVNQRTPDQPPHRPQRRHEGPVGRDADPGGHRPRRRHHGTVNRRSDPARTHRRHGRPRRPHEARDDEQDRRPQGHHSNGASHQTAPRRRRPRTPITFPDVVSPAAAADQFTPARSHTRTAPDRAPRTRRIRPETFAQTSTEDPRSEGPSPSGESPRSMSPTRSATCSRRRTPRASSSTPSSSSTRRRLPAPRAAGRATSRSSPPAPPRTCSSSSSTPDRRAAREVGPKRCEDGRRDRELLVRRSGRGRRCRVPGKRSTRS